MNEILKLYHSNINHKEISHSRFPVWFNELRKQAWENFSEQTIPNKKLERWRYVNPFHLTPKPSPSTSVNFKEHIAEKKRKNPHHLFFVFMNDILDESQSNMNDLPEGLILLPMQEALITYEALFKASDFMFKEILNNPIANLTFATCNQGIFLLASSQVHTPIYFLFLSDHQHPFAVNQHMIYLENKAELTLIHEDSYHSGFTAENHFIFLNPKATLNYYHLQNNADHSHCFSHLFCHQLAESKFTHFNFSQGGYFTRAESIITLQEPNSLYEGNGLFNLENDKQSNHQHLEIKHQSPHTKSEIRYKGILNNQSQAVFNGRVCVNKEAQKVVAYQENHNLLLSEKAEMNSKPELEIYADDVKCKHGATVGQLNEQALFYLQTRGIPREEAKLILREAFVQDMMTILQKAMVI